MEPGGALSTPGYLRSEGPSVLGDALLESVFDCLSVRSSPEAKCRRATSRGRPSGGAPAPTCGVRTQQDARLRNSLGGEARVRHGATVMSRGHQRHSPWQQLLRARRTFTCGQGQPIPCVVPPVPNTRNPAIPESARGLSFASMAYCPHPPARFGNLTVGECPTMHRAQSRTSAGD